MSITLESYLSDRFTEYDDYLHFRFGFYFRPTLFLNEWIHFSQLQGV